MSPSPLPTRERYQREMATIVGGAALVLALVFAGGNHLRGSVAGVWTDLGMAVVIGLAVWVARRTDHFHAVSWLVLVALAGFTLNLGLDGVLQGWLWGAALPPLAFYLSGERRGLMLATLLGLLMAAVLMVSPPTRIERWPGLSVMGSYILVVLVGWSYERLRSAHEEELRNHSLVDGLTGAWNRRKLEAVLGVELARHRRYKRPLTLILFDVDRFKQVNDQLGHARGDEALVAIVSVVMSLVRDTDLVVRLGGDEFAVLAPDTPARDDAGALAGQGIAERVRQAVAAIDWPHDVPLSVSVGVAQAVDGDTEATLYTRADEALYLAKGAGRDQVAVATAPQSGRQPVVPG